MKKGQFSCFSQSDQAFKQYTINTFMHSIAVCYTSSYSERYLIRFGLFVCWPGVGWLACLFAQPVGSMACLLTCSLGLFSRPEFNGTRCEAAVKPCLTNPCLNNGTCVEVEQSSFICTCKVGFTGNKCEIELKSCDSMPCFNSGTCYSQSGNNYTCSCPIGITGRNCETRIDHCSNFICNNGACINDRYKAVCKCNYGYTGNHCETEIEECASNPCQHGGTCVDKVGNFQCKCVNGTGGKFCEHGNVWQLM